MSGSAVVDVATNRVVKVTVTCELPNGRRRTVERDGTRAFASEIYRYGMALDIAKVLSIEVAPAAYCSVVNAHMTYVSSSGEVRGLDYLVQAAACDASG